MAQAGRGGGGAKGGQGGAGSAGSGAGSTGGRDSAMGGRGYGGGASVGGMKTLGSLPGMGTVGPKVGGVPTSNDTMGIAQKALLDRGIAPNPQAAARAIESQRNYLTASINGPSIGDRIVGFFPGVSQQPLSLGDPTSYANGVRHQRFGAFDAGLGLAGMASGYPGAGTVGSFVGTGLDTALGTHWGFGPDGVNNQTGGQQGYNNDPKGFGGYGASGPSQGGVNDGRMGQGGALAGLNTPGSPPASTGALLTTPAQQAQQAASGPKPLQWPGSYLPIGGGAPYGVSLPGYNYTRRA